MSENDVIETILDDGGRQIECVVAREEIGDISLIYRELYDKEGFMYKKGTCLFGRDHGVQNILQPQSHGDPLVETYIAFQGDKVMDNVSPYDKPSIGEFALSFLIKDALYRANGFVDLPDNDKVFLPLLRFTPNVDEALSDLAENGLDAEVLWDAGLDVYSYDFTRDLYINHFDTFETGEIDRYEVATAYMESYDSKTFPDVIVSQAIKETADFIKDVFQESFDKSVVVHMPFVQDCWDMRVELKSLDIPNELGRVKEFLSPSKSNLRTSLKSKVKTLYEEDELVRKDIILKESLHKRGIKL